MAHNASINVGLILCYGLGALLPDPEDVQANQEDQLWRVIWLMPLVIGVVEILLVFVVFRQEPVGYCIMEGRDQEGRNHLARIYRKASVSDQNDQSIE